MKEVLSSLLQKKSLSKKAAYNVMKTIMEGKATPSQVAGFLVALRAKGETIDEIAGFALSMRDASRSLVVNSTLILDNCGTGGDGKNGINVSTAAAFVVAGAGYTVAKHGNRSISSLCGSADVLEALGIKIDTPPVVTERCISSVGMGFMFAPNFHPAMKYAMPTRKELGIRTVFNILGPLTNPARANVQLIGVFDPKLVPVIAQVMAQMGHKAGLSVYSEGWDEITLSGSTDVALMVNKKVKRMKWKNTDFGLPKVQPKHLHGGDKEKNAQIINDILNGNRNPARHVVVANAAALIYLAQLAEKKKNTNLKLAVKLAEEVIDSGKAGKIRDELASASQFLN